MHIIDYVFIVLLFVVQPIHGYFSYQKYMHRIANGEPSDRVKLYRETIVLEWVAFAVLATAWISFGRPSADLGFVSSSTMQILVGSAILALFTAYLLYVWHVARRMSDDEKTEQIDALGDLIHFLPQDKRDYRHFVAVSVTAGVVEEFLYRSYAFWFLAHFMPMWAVVLVSSVAFGLGHTYQGASGVARVTLIGVAFGAFYVFTGSIWLPMLAHAILDILQGASLLEMARRGDDQPLEQHPDHC
jgi:membrane protease YdiL (CAAX protease family)